MKIRIEIETTKERALRLAGHSYQYGYKRENPRKPWSEKELKEAVRYLVDQKLMELL